MHSLVTCSEGDLRKSMTFLHTAYRLKGEEGISQKDVLEITAVCFFYLFIILREVMPF